AEVGVRRAGREHEVVVRDGLAAVDDDVAGDRIDLANLREQDLDVLLPAQDPPNRRRDIARRQGRRGGLIQQRLKQMVVVPIEERDLDIRTSQRARHVQPAEAAADDHDARAGSRFAVRGSGFWFSFFGCRFWFFGYRFWFSSRTFWFVGSRFWS